MPSLGAAWSYVSVPTCTWLNFMSEMNRKVLLTTSILPFSRYTINNMIFRARRNFSYGARVDNESVRVCEPYYAFSRRGISVNKGDNELLIDDLETRNLRGQFC